MPDAKATHSPSIVPVIYRRPPLRLRLDLSKHSPWELYHFCHYMEALPFLDLALLWPLHADNLVAVEQA